MTTIWNAGWLAPLTGGESGIISHHASREGAATAIVDHVERRLSHGETPLTPAERAALLAHLATNVRLMLFWRMNAHHEPVEGIAPERRQEIGDLLDEIYTLAEAPLLG